MHFPETGKFGGDATPMLRMASPNQTMNLPSPDTQVMAGYDQINAESDIESALTPKTGKTQYDKGGTAAMKAPAAKGKTRVTKRTKRKTVASRGRRTDGDYSSQFGSLNYGSLMNNDIVRDAQTNQGLRSQPTFAGKTTRRDALNALIASIPKEHQDTTRGMKKKLDDACKMFRCRGLGSMKPDGDTGNFRLKPMKSSLKHFQLISAA